MRFGRSLETLSTNLDPGLLADSHNLNGYGMLVADGIGGMAGGEAASRLALTRLVDLLVDTPDWIMSLYKQEDAMAVLRRMRDRFLLIDKSIRAEAERVRSLRGMGTTLTVAGTLGSEVVIGHVGDSRAYLLRAGKLTQLTTDHTLAQALIDAGIATPADPSTRSMRHVLTGALGSLGESVQPQVHRLRLFSNDQLLLCTDGLTEMVDDKAIAAVLGDANSSQEACNKLIEFALSAGGLDNVTVVLARLGAPSIRKRVATV
jgi:protein phosphatase